MTVGMHLDSVLRFLLSVEISLLSHPSAGS